ncbi:MAG: polysaccharide deacetylase family protein [Terrimicrobiaceae bacterium]|nr:polysaccharide deacetylase family protein [Terrimicrobiaceae bacterium]
MKKPCGRLILLSLLALAFAVALEKSTAADPTRVFALVFDDAPFPQTTEMVLENLKKHGMRATFAIVGDYAEKYPELLRRIVEGGHELANHCWSHTPLEELSTDQFLAEIEATSATIERIVGRGPEYFRAPFGYLPPRHLPAVQAAKLRIIEPTLDSGMWRNPPPDKVRATIVTGITPYSVILCHLSFPKSIASFPKILDELNSTGFRSTTLTDLRRLQMFAFK